MESLNTGILKGLPLVLPPITEQAHLTEWAEAETRKTTRAIEGAESGIALIREYRTRLIADVVTAKLDVREAAARLPDEADEPESDVEELLDDGDAAEDAELDAELEEVEA